MGTVHPMANPFEDILGSFNVLREQVRQGADAEWLERLDPRRSPQETRSLDDLQAELDSLVGLESVKEQVRALVAFLEHVERVVSVHGFGGLRGDDDRWITGLLGGSNRELAAEVALLLREALPHYKWIDDLDRIPRELRGLHPDNPVNRPRQAGVQLELPPRVRGLGPFWADFRAEHGDDALPPHTEALIAALADAALAWPSTP